MEATIFKHGSRTTAYYIENLDGFNLVRFFEKKTKYSSGRFVLEVIYGDVTNYFVTYRFEFALGRRSLRWEKVRTEVTCLFKNGNYYHVSKFGEVA